MNIIMADRQDITRLGMEHLLEKTEKGTLLSAHDKRGLIRHLEAHPDSGVILDYTLFDFNDVEELLILGHRFPQSVWLLFSEELSVDFIRRILTDNPRFSILTKESPEGEIEEALHYMAARRRFICQQIAELLLHQEAAPMQRPHLTRVETEVLADIAQGLTTKEIAEKRVSSFHTVNTHRKNIFRKLGVNSVHEATKYALRAGLVDSAEYYI